ncbi:MAG TPA: hypothetical protein VH950_04270 [Gaiellaceae bacterium]
MSSIESGERGGTGVDIVAGLMASAAIVLAALAIVDRPARFAPVAMALALVAARMSERFQRLGLIAAVAAMSGWVLGMTFAVITDNPLF